MVTSLVQSSTFQPLFQSIKQCKKALPTLLFISAIINLLALAPSIYMLQIYDRVLTAQHMGTLVVLSGILVFLFFVSAMLENHRADILLRVGNAFDESMLNTLGNAMVQRSIMTQGKDASAQAMRDFGTIRQFIYSPATHALFDAPWMPIYLVTLFLFHPWFGVMALMAMGIATSISIYGYQSTRRIDKESNAMASQAYLELESLLRKSHIAVALGMKQALTTQWQNTHQQHLMLNTTAMDKHHQFSSISKYFRMAVQSAALGLGAYLQIQGEITGGMMIAGSILMGKTMMPIDQLLNASQAIINCKDAQLRLNELLLKCPEQTQRHQLPPPLAHIEMKGVFVTAPLQRNIILKGIHFAAQGGQVVGIVGPSGSGKTTLLQVMCGLWPIHAGSYRLGKADVGQYNTETLGQYIGYLPQSVDLIEGSIAQNISRFQRDCESETILAAKMADVHFDITQLPEGYNTQLGTNGEGISGGLKQRIGLARALFRMPKLLFLDEPNSNLDDKGEMALVNAIESCKQNGGLVVLVTHKKHILRICDQLLYINQGELQAFGPRDTVLNQLQVQQKNHTNMRGQP